MHEIRASVPAERSSQVAQLAHDAGIPHVSIFDVDVSGREGPRQVVSVESSTPRAKAFLDALLDSPLFDPQLCSVTSRELRAIVSSEDVGELTQPMREPAADVLDDLWQMSHVTAGYVARAAAGSILLADGVIKNSAISIVVAALFLPYLSPVLGFGFGAWSGDRGLLRKAARAVAVSTAIAYAAGAAVAFAERTTAIAFTDFRGFVASFIVSAAIGAAAGMSTADDVGRRYLIGVAAAVQLAILPVWLGAATVAGFPSARAMLSRAATLLLNAGTIVAVAVAAYASMGMHRKEMRRVVERRRTGR